MRGALLAICIFIATAVLVVIGTLSPIPSAIYYAGSGNGNVLRSPSTPEIAIQDLGIRIRQHQMAVAWNSLANKAEFTESDFAQDVTGFYQSLRTQATLETVSVQPLHQSDDQAEMRVQFHWTTILGPYEDSRDMQVVRDGDSWQVDWPLVKRPSVPAQVIPVNYLRWDVIYSGATDEWGSQNVAGPNVRIVDMRPVNRAEGVYVLGELLDDDVVPAWVDVRATLIGKDGKVLGSEDSFDMISHRLLPKQVTPFRIHFPDIDLSQVASIRMQPESILISASADPVIEILNEKYTALPVASLTGQLSDQSGQVVNFAHVLTTFYDSNGNVIWVAGRYIGRALPPQTPVDFTLSVPEDLAKKVSSERTIVAAYSPRGGETL